MSGGPAMTVVVMGYRNAQTIAGAVDSVVGQRCHEPFEIVVVTSGGDDSAGVVRQAHPDLTVIESASRMLPGAARNAGIDAARGAVVAFLAADCEAEPGWVQARLDAHRQGRPVVAGAMTAGPSGQRVGPVSFGSHLALYSYRLPGRPAGPVVAPDPAVHGLSYTRAALDRIGPFATDVLIGEDTAAATRLATAGTEIWFEPTVRTAHRGPTSVRELLASHRRRGVATARWAPEPMSRAAAAIRVPVAALATSADALRTAWRFSPSRRGRVVAAAPWVVAARAATAIGHYQVRVDLDRPGRGVRRRISWPAKPAKQPTPAPAPTSATTGTTRR